MVLNSTSCGSGDAPRWQVIGLIAIVVGLSVLTLGASDERLRDDKFNRRDLSSRALEVSQTKIDLCRACNTVDDVIVWLLYEHSRLTRAVKGEACFDTYRAGRKTINALVTLRLHQKEAANSDAPFLLTELRKRLLTSIYVTEISTASFLGRLPRLAHRYSSIDPPLDLRDECLLLEGPELATAVDVLNSAEFWSSGRIYHTTWLRAWLPFAQLREEILDLALGRHEKGAILDRAKAIQRRDDEAWSDLPPFMRESIQDSLQNRLPLLELLHRMVLQQDHRSNELLLQRVLMRKTGATSEKLVRVA